MAIKKMTLTKWELPKSLDDAVKKIYENRNTIHENYYTIGKTLRWIKNELQYGEFTKWVKTNLPFLSGRTARRVMLFSQRIDNQLSNVQSEDFIKELAENRMTKIKNTPDNFKIQFGRSYINLSEAFKQAGGGIARPLKDTLEKHYAVFVSELQDNMKHLLSTFIKIFHFDGSETVTPLEKRIMWAKFALQIISDAISEARVYTNKQKKHIADDNEHRRSLSIERIIFNQENQKFYVISPGDPEQYFNDNPPKKKLITVQMETYYHGTVPTYHPRKIKGKSYDIINADEYIWNQIKENSKGKRYFSILVPEHKLIPSEYVKDYIDANGKKPYKKEI